MSRLTFLSFPGSIMLSTLYLLARLAVIAVALFLFLSDTTGVMMVYWALAAGVCLTTLVGSKRKTPKGEEVLIPKQIPLDNTRVAYAGPARAFTTYFGGWDIDPESISMTAMKRGDGYTVAVDKGGDYDDIVNTLFKLRLIREPGRHTTMSWDKGYLTSEGRFVTGKKVIKIARLAGQLPNDTPLERLISIQHLSPTMVASEGMAVVS